MVFDRTEWQRRYNKENREKINDYYREYYKTHKATHIARVIDWRKRNPKKTQEYRNSVYSDPKRYKAMLDYQARWRKENKDKIKAYHKKWNAKRKLKKL